MSVAKGVHSDTTGMLQFVCAAGLSSWGIARFGVQKAAFSHVDIVLAAGTYDGAPYPHGALLGARDDAIGGQPPGVRIRPPGYEKWIRREVVKVHAPQGPAALAWALREVGARYDDDAILGFLFGQRWHKRGAFICSVLAGNYELRAGAIHGTPANLQGTSPNTLYAMTLAVGGVVQ